MKGVYLEMVEQCRWDPSAGGLANGKNRKVYKLKFIQNAAEILHKQMQNHC